MDRPDPTALPYLDKFQGCIIGGAAGDALGYPVEFMGYADIVAQYGEAGITDYSLDPATGKALVSDDTQMTLFTANGMLIGQTRAQVRGVSGNPECYMRHTYLDWLRTQRPDYDGNPADSWLLDVPELHSRRAPGNTCLEALSSGRFGTMDDPINDSKGCGGAMRVAPVALYDGGPARAAEWAAEVAALTHGHPLGFVSAGAFAYIVNRCAFQVPTFCADRKRELAAIVRDCAAELCRIFPGHEDAARDMADRLARAADAAEGAASDHDAIVRLGRGWVGEEALSIAVFSCLRHPDDFGAAITAAVNHGGDSDSTGAIAGNIMGALLGVGAIGREWTRDLELLDVLLEISTDLCAGCPPIDEYSTYKDPRWLSKYSRDPRPARDRTPRRP